MTTGYINMGMGDVGVSFHALLAVVTYIHYLEDYIYIYKCGFIAGQVLVIFIYSWDIVSQSVSDKLPNRTSWNILHLSSSLGLILRKDGVL